MNTQQIVLLILGAPGSRGPRFEPTPASPRHYREPSKHGQSERAEIGLDWRRGRNGVVTRLIRRRITRVVHYPVFRTLAIAWRLTTVPSAGDCYARRRIRADLSIWRRQER